MAKRMQAGQRLIYGGIATREGAAAYNAISERIESFERAGRAPPDYLLNGRHNLYHAMAG